MKENTVRLTGPVIKTGIHENPDGTQEVVCVMGVIRGFRHIGDGRENVKIDRPVIMSRNQDMIDKIITWHKNDIVNIKGAVTSRTVMKESTCPFCKHKNYKEGLNTYVEPIFVEKLFTTQDDSSSVRYLNTIREISNEVKLFGSLTREPKKIKIRNGPVVTQYPLAVRRKFIIREDLPSVDTDFPWVKVYGTNALSDRERLRMSSQVYIDGILQSRGINMKSTCLHCGKVYEWKARALEIVPYETEYVKDYYTDEEVEENEKKRKALLLKSRGLDKFDLSIDLANYDDDEITSEDIEAGIDAFEEDDE